MIEEWIEYRKDDPATHPGFEGAYLVTILSKTGARYVEIRPFSFSSLFAGDWSRYSVQAWRPVPAAFGGTATAPFARQRPARRLFGRARTLAPFA